MKIAIYTPYLDSVGGGEKYVLTIAECLSEDHQVDVLLDKHLQTFDIKNIVDKLSTIQNLNLQKVNFIPAPIGAEDSLVKKSLFLKQYDWLFFNTDGSLFFSSAKNSVLHVQIPFSHMAIHGVLGKLKTQTWKQVIYNSHFTQDIVQKYLPLSGKVVYPPVSIEEFWPNKKQKNILTVGRLVGSGIKKQDVMIEAFKTLVGDPLVKGWSLHIAGAAGEGDQPFIDSLKKMANGFPIFFYPNISFKDLTTLYADSSIYWHAMGYEETSPERFEHFGITTVEAMAAGAVPVVINKGGQKEIIEDGMSGFVWDDITHLHQRTLQLIVDPKMRERMSELAIKRSKDFSKEAFVRNIKEIVNE